MTDPAEPASPISDPPPPSSRTRRSRNRPELARRENVNKARTWLLVVAVLQLLFGIYFGMQNNKQSDDAIRNLAKFEADEKVEADGKEYIVSDLRAQVERERIQAFVVPIGLGVALCVLWRWAKRAALAALVSALLLYLTVLAIDAVIDPMQLARGLVIKALFITAMVIGIKAALAQRVAGRRLSEEQDAATGSSA